MGQEQRRIMHTYHGIETPVKTDEYGKVVDSNTQILGFKKIEHKILFLENCIMQIVFINSHPGPHQSLF